MVNDQSSDGFSDVIDRRNFAKIAGASGVAMLAGCDGDGQEETPTESGEETSDDGGDEQDVYDVTVDGAAALDMGTLHWNPAFIAWPNIWGRWMTHERLAQYNLQTQEWIPRLIEEWSTDGDTFTVQIRDDANWASGDPITSEDVKTHILCSMAAGGPLGNIVDSFDTSDEKTLVITGTGDVNPKIFEFNVLSNLLQSKNAEPYADWATRYWEDGDEDVGSEITSYKPDEPDYISGAMSFVEMTDQYYLLERNTEHFNADNINFKEYQFTASPGNQSKWRAMQNNEFDTVMSVFTPSRIVADLDKSWNEYQFPGYWGFGLLFNHDAENAPHVSKNTVRKAIANAVSRQACADNAGPRVKNPAPTPAAIASNVQDQWIDVGGTFSEMQDAEQVAPLMEEAGYSKNNNDVWEHPDDGEATIEVISPQGWSDWEVMANTVGQQLRSAGFDANVNLIGNGTIVGERIPNGDFQIAGRAWLPGNARSSYPFFPLRHVLGDSFDNAQAYPGWEEENQPVEVPAMDGSGTMEVDVRATLDEIASSADEDANAEKITELAWVTHQELPWLPIVTKKEQSMINTQNLSAPAGDAEQAQLKWPCMYLPKIGDMQWKGE
ncbi:ABC transporter substrate-binding protein [Halococcoides cellulosivorans]|uniref:ABC transporter substrate-binding protein n=1 Tax=Halococcoides cellulosivorans TaxID=1679096 RepID=A0A2R4X2T9_9EURY|nr:ABC transporter substrate-binding protein [Halococcoides cellulosivorans]AWB28116.1 ABC transporter substrate-binding protein [Halococcoides cellulosivorans]